MDREAAGGPDPGQGRAKGDGEVDDADGAGPGRAGPDDHGGGGCARAIGLKEQRVAAAKLLTGPMPKKLGGDVKEFINDVKAALYCSKICSYAQGMAMIAAAEQTFKYGMHLDEIARIWKAGCIIRAVFLDEIKKAFKEQPGLSNLLLTGRFRDMIASRQEAWRRVLGAAVQNGIATPAFSASLAYYDSYRRDAGRRI